MQRRGPRMSMGLPKRFRTRLKIGWQRILVTIANRFPSLVTASTKRRCCVVWNCDHPTVGRNRKGTLACQWHGGPNAR